jgi:hypothetical protein
MRLDCDYIISVRYLATGSMSGRRSEQKHCRWHMQVPSVFRAYLQEVTVEKFGLNSADGNELFALLFAGFWSCLHIARFNTVFSKSVRWIIIYGLFDAEALIYDAEV